MNRLLGPCIALVLSFSVYPVQAGSNFTNVIYHRCYDGDTCTFTLPHVHPLFGEKINVRIAGIDTPEIRGKCDQEKASAKKARDVVRGILQNAYRIDLLNAKRGILSYRRESYGGWEGYRTNADRSGDGRGV